MNSRRLIVISTAALLVAGGCATIQPKSTGSAERGAWIASKIAEAERLGAAECSPRQLAKAKVALEHVMHEVGEGYYSDAWLEPNFVAADTVADELLAERRLAASLGGRFKCVSASSKGREGRWRRPDSAEPLSAREQRLLPWPAGDYVGAAGERRSELRPFLMAVD